MPELPEVESTRLQLHKKITGQILTGLVVRQTQLRWPIEPQLAHYLIGQEILSLQRRSKYLILKVARGHLLIHLGMSGSLQFLSDDSAFDKHCHVDFLFKDGSLLRFRDPRRFGALVWTELEPKLHPLLRSLGPEPLSPEFSGAYLEKLARGRKQAIKPFLMDAHRVVGVGNIYAQEALFNARISPVREVSKLKRADCERLVKELKTLLRYAIRRGGTTVRDFLNPEGDKGSFKEELAVYGRAEQACKRCQALLCLIRQQNRSTVYCPACQV